MKAPTTEQPYDKVNHAEPELAVGDLCLVGVVWLEVAERDGRLVLEDLPAVSS